MEVNVFDEISKRILESLRGSQCFFSHLFIVVVKMLDFLTDSMNHVFINTSFTSVEPSSRASIHSSSKRKVHHFIYYHFIVIFLKVVLRSGYILGIHPFIDSFNIIQVVYVASSSWYQDNRISTISRQEVLVDLIICLGSSLLGLEGCHHVMGYSLIIQDLVILYCYKIRLPFISHYHGMYAPSHRLGFITDLSLRIDSSPLYDQFYIYYDFTSSGFEVLILACCFYLLCV